MDALLQVSGICKRFAGVVAVDDVSIAVNANEVKCIIGANGAGKTTLFNIVCGSLRADSGTVTFEKKIFEWSEVT